MLEQAKQLLSKLMSSNSDVSAMRVMAFVSLFTGVILAFIGLYKHSELYGLAALVGVFVGSAFGGKVLQKAQEMKDSSKDG